MPEINSHSVENFFLKLSEEKSADYHKNYDKTNISLFDEIDKTDENRQICDTQDINSGSEDVWTTCDKSEFSQTFSQISNITENLTPEVKQLLSSRMSDLFVSFLATDSGFRDQDSIKLTETYNINGYNLNAVKTVDGYNIYSESGNTVATLNNDYELETGVLDPYLNGTDTKDFEIALKNASDEEYGIA